MKTIVRIALILGMLMFVVMAPAQRARHTSELAYLNRYIGKYPYASKMWTSQPLNRRLHLLLKSDYARLMENMQVSGPLQKEGTLVMMTGNKTHDGGQNDACLLVDPKQDVINVLLNLNKKLKSYKEHDTTLPVTGEAKAWLDNVKFFQ